MSSYLGPDSKNTKYCLTGVLMHVGPDANHGHYVSHIQDMQSGHWFKFSDETVAPLQAKNLKLGHESDESLTLKKQQPKMPRTPKTGGVQSSNNAYMLVYMEKQHLLQIRANEIRENSLKDASKRSPDNSIPVDFPLHLKTKIEKDNLEFDEERSARLTSRIQEKEETRMKHKKMTEYYSSLSWDSDDDEDDTFEFLPLTWLIKWLANPNTCGLIETEELLCTHEKLDIDKLTEVKVVDCDIVSALYEEYGEGDGPRLDSTKLCHICVSNRARLISLSSRMTRDVQVLASQKSPDDGTGYWVGKKRFVKILFLV